MVKLTLISYLQLDIKRIENCVFIYIKAQFFQRTAISLGLQRLEKSAVFYLGLFTHYLGTKRAVFRDPLLQILCKLTPFSYYQP
jgi:hypothetical protein